MCRDLQLSKTIQTITMPDIVYGIAGFDKLLLQDIFPNVNGFTSVCKDAYFRTLSLNISEPPLGKMSFSHSYCLKRIRIKMVIKQNSDKI